MSGSRRANGAGSVYIKHGSYYGRWLTDGGGHTNRKLGPVRPPGTSEGLLRRQAERRLRELMAEVVVVTDITVTVGVAGRAWIEALEAKGRSKSHSRRSSRICGFTWSRSSRRSRSTGSAKSTSRAFSSTSREQQPRALGDRRAGSAAKTARNVLSTLHSIFELGLRRRWAGSNPCKLVDAPVVQQSGEIRFLMWRPARPP